MSEKYDPGSWGLTWEVLKKVFPVAPSLRREHWDLLSGLGIRESQRNDDAIFYEALLHRFRGDAAFAVQFDERFLASKRKKDRDKSFFSRALLWLHREIPALIDYDDLFDVQAGIFGGRSAERELWDMLLGMLHVAEEATARSAPDAEARWELARSELRAVLDEADRPTPEAVERIDAVAKALLEAGRDYGKLSAETERRRSDIHAVLKPVSDRERAAEILKRLDSLDAGRLATLADMAEKARRTMETLTETEAVLARKAGEFDRLRSGGAPWSTIAKQASAIAELEAERNRHDAALSAALDRMAAVSAPPSATAAEDASVPVPARKAGKRRPKAPAGDPQTQTPVAGTDCPEAEPTLPTCWAEFPSWCEQHLGDRLSLSARARSSIKKAQYDDVAAAARCMLWLAGDYRRARLEGAGDGLQGPVPAGTGFQNERCGGDSFDFRWQGRRVRADWHVRNGGNTRDPVRCLRIYYCWHQDEGGRVLVGDMPAHVRSRMS